MIVGIVGSRRRNSTQDLISLERVFVNTLTDELGVYFGDIDSLGSGLRDITIVTGDCDKGGDHFAKYLANIYKCKLDEKKIKDPETGKEMDFKNHRWFDWFTMCTIFYDRNEEIVKEPLDYLIALVAPDRKGGTENTIRHFRRLHKDWKDKLIIL